MFVVGLVFLLFVAPVSLLAVFKQASAFNQDVSKWITSSVTTMLGSKCTRSLSLFVATAPSVVGYMYSFMFSFDNSTLLLSCLWVLHVSFV